MEKTSSELLGLPLSTHQLSTGMEEDEMGSVLTIPASSLLIGSIAARKSMFELSSKYRQECGLTGPGQESTSEDTAEMLDKEPSSETSSPGSIHEEYLRGPCLSPVLSSSAESSDMCGLNDQSSIRHAEIQVQHRCDSQFTDQTEDFTALDETWPSRATPLRHADWMNF